MQNKCSLLIYVKQIHIINENCKKKEDAFYDSQKEETKLLQV